MPAGQSRLFLIPLKKKNSIALLRIIIGHGALSTHLFLLGHTMRGILRHGAYNSSRWVVMRHETMRS